MGYHYCMIVYYMTAGFTTVPFLGARSRMGVGMGMGMGMGVGMGVGVGMGMRMWVGMGDGGGDGDGVEMGMGVGVGMGMGVGVWVWGWGGRGGCAKTFTQKKPQPHQSTVVALKQPLMPIINTYFYYKNSHCFLTVFLAYS